MTIAELYLKWADIIVRLVQSVAWPITIAFLGYFVLRNYKPAIENMLARLKKSTFPGGSLELVTETEKQIIEKTKELEETRIQEDEAKLKYEAIISDLMEKAKLQEKERISTTWALTEADHTIQELRKKQNELELELENAEAKLRDTAQIHIMQAPGRVERVSPPIIRVIHKDILIQVADGFSFDDAQTEIYQNSSMRTFITKIQPRGNNQYLFNLETSNPMGTEKIINGFKNAKTFTVLDYLKE